MQTYELVVRNRSIAANSDDTTLVRTSVGIDQVHVLFDNDEWADFPITITFAQGDVVRSTPLVVTEFDGSDEWYAEATVEVPREVIDMTGAIRVTLQGTSEDGRHIITAAGSPLSVEEAGDVVIGDVPDDAPEIDEWRQAYALAMEAANRASALVADLEARVADIVSDAQAGISQSVTSLGIPATTESLGVVQIGDGLAVTNDGIVSATAEGMTAAQASTLYNLMRLAQYAFDTSFDEQGVVTSDAKVKPSALPTAGISKVGAVKVDDSTVFVTTDGAISARQYELPVATRSVLGGVMPDGTTILNESGTISARTADVGVLGMVKPDGTTITISQDGTITASGGGPDGYVLPVAGIGQLGGVRVDGETILIDEDGVIRIAFADASEEEF